MRMQIAGRQILSEQHATGFPLVVDLNLGIGSLAGFGFLIDCFICLPGLLQFEESKELAETSMYNLLDNEVEQLSQLSALCQVFFICAHQCSAILQLRDQ